MTLSDDQLRALSHLERHRVWVNARALVAQIEALGLPYDAPTGLKLDSPIGRQMTAIIYSPEGRMAGILATEQGLPALAGVEPLLVSQMGDDYAKTYEATIQAGYVVTQMMKANGFRKTNQNRPMPSESVAKTAAFFVRATTAG
ncbi:hypothetical protein [Salinarimonas soli]|uniref:Uncharacterized protein n=1 Tax=Salinarimonas soli TaxID=1638099 RepID=A0A5B2VEF0_9HYPH|nr:hypothetical protein [Salinarimonas soli]KAA2236802.1 hypothetical protein F0L46_12470 [Salinarimonas soli]